MMGEEKKIKDSIDFVASNYDDKYFSKAKAWRKLMPSEPFRNIRRIAAASAVAVALTASAFIFHVMKNDKATPPDNEIKIENSSSPVADKYFCTRIEFKDASLKDVVDKIEQVYQVKIVNIPDSDIRLTLSYEGTAEELIDAINEISETELKVER